jgi:hypothetical protein
MSGDKNAVRAGCEINGKAAITPGANGRRFGSPDESELGTGDRLRRAGRRAANGDDPSSCVDGRGRM